MTTRPAASLAARPAAPWRAGQALALAGLGAVVVGAAVAPALVLRVVWGVVVPLLPATFLLSPVLWRGICPLASLNELGNRLGRGAAPSARTSGRLAVAGLALFALLVPARHLVFNERAGVLAATALAVGLLALGLGARYASRAGFCNGLCPVLPVERLYGQAPLLQLGRGRCATCDVCTPRGCLDLAGDKALAQAMGPARRTHAWLGTPLGLFAAALPGFIAGYYLLPHPPRPSLALAYGAPLGGAVASVAVAALVVRVTGLSARNALVALAAAAVGLHYWFAGPALAEGLGLGGRAAPALRALAFGLVAAWTWRALRRPAPLARDLAP